MDQKPKEINIGTLPSQELKEVLTNLYLRVGELNTEITRITSMCLNISHVLQEREAKQTPEPVKMTLPKLKKPENVSYEYAGNQK